MSMKYVQKHLSDECKCKYIEEIDQETPASSRDWSLPPKTYESNFIHHYFLQFEK